MRINSLLVPAIIAVHACQLIQAQVTAEQVVARARKIDGIFKVWDRKDAPGMSIGVIHEGKLVHARGFGMANLEHGIPNGSGTVFRIGSTSKQFTAACLALLVLGGKLKLQDEVRKHLPEMTEHDPPVLVRHLVHHTSGLPDYLTLASLAGRGSDVYTPGESIALVCRWPRPFFEPGSRFSYSNSNYLLMGELVKRLSGKSLREFAQEHLFGPLGMKHTHFHDRHDHVVPGRADGYAFREGEWRVANTTLEHVGDGGVFTSVEDLLRWDRNFYENQLAGGSARFLELMHSTEPLTGGKPSDYAFGLRVTRWRGAQVVQHGGAFVGFRAETMRFPEHRLTVICLANFSRARPTLLCRRMAEVLLEDHLGPRPERAPRSAPSKRQEPAWKPSSAELARIAGRYVNETLPATYTLTPAGGGLQLHLRGRPIALRPAGRDRLRGRGLDLRVHRLPDGSPAALVISTNRAGDVWFQRVPEMNR